MSLLKRVGIILAKGTQIILGITPFLQGTSQSVAGRTADILQQIMQIVVDMEVLGVKWGLTGVQKLEGAVIQATSIFLRSMELAGKKIENAALFNEGVTDVVNGIVKIMNSVKDDGIEVKDVVK